MISRVIGAPRELVFEAFTEVRHFTVVGTGGVRHHHAAFEFHVGGEWDFVMHGPDGTDYQEWISWTEIAPPERIALLHGESHGDPNALVNHDARIADRHTLARPWREFNGEPATGNIRICSPTRSPIRRRRRHKPPPPPRRTLRPPSQPARYRRC